MAGSWDMTEVPESEVFDLILFKRLRNFAVVVSKKHRDWKTCKYCIAIKIDSPKLKNCGGITMELVQKVIFYH